MIFGEMGAEAQYNLMCGAKQGLEKKKGCPHFFKFEAHNKSMRIHITYPSIIQSSVFYTRAQQSVQWYLTNDKP